MTPLKFVTDEMLLDIFPVGTLYFVYSTKRPCDLNVIISSSPIQIFVAHLAPLKDFSTRSRRHSRYCRLNTAGLSVSFFLTDILASNSA